MQDVRRSLCGPLIEEKGFLDWMDPDDFRTLWGELEPHLRAWYKGASPSQRRSLERRAGQYYGPTDQDVPKYISAEDLVSSACMNEPWPAG